MGLWTLQFYDHFTLPPHIDASDPVAVKYVFHCKTYVDLVLLQLLLALDFVLCLVPLDWSSGTLLPHWTSSFGYFSSVKHTYAYRIEIWTLLSLVLITIIAPAISNVTALPVFQFPLPNLRANSLCQCLLRAQRTARPNSATSLSSGALAIAAPCSLSRMKPTLNSSRCSISSSQQHDCLL